MKVNNSNMFIPYQVVHELKGRMRLRPVQPDKKICSVADFSIFLGYLAESINITISHRTGSVLLVYDDPTLQNILWKHLGLNISSKAFSSIANHNFGELGLVKVAVSSQRVRSNCPKAVAANSASANVELVEYEVKNPMPNKMLSFVFPELLNVVLAIYRSVPYIVRGVLELVKGKLGLNVLDASALGVCLLRRDFKALSSITFFFSLGEFLSGWIRKKSHANLAASLALNITHVWIKKGELEQKVALTDVLVGDLVVVRAGSVIPVDGTVVEGDALVNQSSMTGEPLAVHRQTGSSVYAGTVVEEGEICISASKVGGQARINAILQYIEESESAKASIQGKYERIADGIVPYNFLLAALVLLVTRNPLRAGSVLLVDYSCAIRIATPIAILSAMQEAAGHGVLIKGGRFVEALAEADVVVFDKTGTLTEAKPVVVAVIPFAGYDGDTILRIAACLEEHFPHPVGQAVVQAAELKNLQHREEHAKVEFVVAHGIASQLQDQRVIIGSEHFIVEDEKIVISPECQLIVDEQAEQGRSILYLAVGGQLAGVIAIEDTLRPEVPAMISAMRADGFKRIIMLTGDGKVTAAAIAKQAGITEFKAQLLPEEKAEFISQLQKEGYSVLMVGDGVNDGPALSVADVGAALSNGSDMAKEVADIVLTNGNPADLLLARRLARLVLLRIRGNFHKSLFWNSIFLVAGLTGFLRPSISAFLHNASTAIIAAQSVVPLLPESLAMPELNPELASLGENND